VLKKGLSFGGKETTKLPKNLEKIEKEAKKNAT